MALTGGLALHRSALEVTFTGQFIDTLRDHDCGVVTVAFDEESRRTPEVAVRESCVRRHRRDQTPSVPLFEFSEELVRNLDVGHT